MELYLTTRFPDWNLTFLNAGISGDTATGGANRFASHVLAEKPTALTIDFGMNDGGYGAFDKGRFDDYVKNTEAMLKAAKEASIRVAADLAQRRRGSQQARPEDLPGDAEAVLRPAEGACGEIRRLVRGPVRRDAGNRGEDRGRQRRA